jgi:hypothetical protein
MCLPETCRALSPAEGQGCHFYEGHVTASILSKGGALPDVTAAVETIFQGTDITADSDFQVAYGGVPVNDTTDNPRDGLQPPSQNNEPPTEAPQRNNNGNNTITIVGGLLVGAFCLAFLGIFFILWRRRQVFLDERESQFAFSKPDAGAGATESQSHGDGEEQRNKSLEAPNGDFDMDDDGEEMGEDGYSPSYPNNITFDLGNSFKDQLMGVHGRSQPSSKLGMPGYNMHGIPDNTSESDADSWAQTDGTIGSLELQLEPITAEV